MVNYYEFLDEYTFYAPKEQDPCPEISHDDMKPDTKENGDQVVAAAPTLAPPDRMYEAFPKKWYLTGKIPNVLTSRAEQGPYKLINVTNVSIVHPEAETTTYWIYIGVIVPADVLKKLRAYADKKPAAEVQSLEVEVSVKIDNSMTTMFKSVYSLLNQHHLSPDDPIVLRAHQEIKLDKEQKLQLAFKPMNQIKQAGGLHILWVEMVDLKSASDPSTTTPDFTPMTAPAHVPQSPVIEVRSNSSAFSKGDDVIVGPTVNQPLSRWYLTLNNKEITAGQTKSDPYVVDKKTRFTIEPKGESGRLWVIIYTSFSKSAVRKEVSEISITQKIIVTVKVDKKEQKFTDQFTLSKQQTPGADSSVLILLRRPITLKTGDSFTLEFSACAQSKQAGFKVHNIDLVKDQLKKEIEDRMDITRMKRDESFHQKNASSKKGLVVEKKPVSNHQACGTASGGNSGSSSSSISNSAAKSAAKSATSSSVINATSPKATNAARGTINTTLSNGAASTSSSVSSSSSSTASSASSSTLISTATSNTSSATINTTLGLTNSATNSATNTSDESITKSSQETPIAPGHCQSAAKSSIEPASSANTTVPTAVTVTSSPSTPENNKDAKVEDTASAVEPKSSALTDQEYKQNSQLPPDEVIEIAAFKIDKSGTKLATLSCSETSFYLDIWDIEDAMHNPGLNGKTVKIDVATGRTPHSTSSSTEPLASLKREIGQQLHWDHHKSMTVVLSYGAAQVALISHSVGEPKPQPFSLFECSLARKTLMDDRPHEDLKWFVGYGDFCCPLSDDGTPDTAHEKFLACDGYSVTIYRCPTDRPWTLLWNISLAEAPPRSPTPIVGHENHRRNSADPWYCPGEYPECDSLLPKTTPTPEGLALAKKLVQGARHRYFAWTGHAKAVTIWNFEMGTVVSYIPLPHEHEISDICTYLSVDGSVVVVWYKGHGLVGTYRTVSGICIKEYKDKAGIFGGQFLVSEVKSPGQVDLLKTKSHLVSLLDGSKRHLAKSLHELHGTITISSTGNQSLLRLKGSMVTVTGLDTAFAHILNNWNCKPTCGELVDPKLSEDRIYRAGTECDTGVVFDFRRVSGTQFVMERALVSKRVLYTLKLIFKEEPKEKTVLMFSHRFKYAMLSGDAEHLILVDERYVQIWMIPASCAMHCRLLLAWSVNQGTNSDGFWREPFNPRLCSHSRILTMDTTETGQSIALNLSDPKVFTEKTAGRFLGGIQLLMEMYTSIREINPQTPGYRRDYLTSAISKYLGGYINHDPTPHQPLNTVLAQICLSWTHEAREMYKDILSSILHCWSPPPHYRSIEDSDGNRVSSNPINILLTRNEAFVINTAKLFYKFCLRRASETRQIGYLAPVFDSLPLLFLQHQKHAFKYFRKMALIKAAEASFLRETYPVVAHTAEGSRCHQQTEDAPPCLHHPADLDHSDDEGNGNERDVYVASYDMLWKYSDHRAEEDEVSTLSWLAKIFAQGLGPFGHNFIQRHKFCLKFLDNPAIEALIDQQWNTIGLRYWRVCFISQCCVLALLLYVVLGQLNGSDQNEHFGHFVAIATSAAFFLWLQIIQVFFKTDEDSSLGYNIVGILSFSVPLAGSVNQICIALGGKVLNAAYLFSLSLVVFSLHLLFELRVFKSIFKFVSILVAVVSGLKTVLLVLSLSIIVFGTAILHAFTLSATATAAVPRTVYFLMLLFVFFVMIVILYILLHLVNATYKVADAEWLLHWNDNRLCYVERAENWTMIFPGFRKGTGVLHSRHVFFSPAPSALRAFKTRHQEATETSFTRRN